MNSKRVCRVCEKTITDKGMIAHCSERCLDAGIKAATVAVRAEHVAFKSRQADLRAATVGRR